MTWCSVDSATPRFVLASSAIRCCFVERFVRLKVLSRVSHQRLSPHGAPLSSIGSRWVRFPDVIGLIEARIHHNFPSQDFTHMWRTMGSFTDNPMGIHWIGIVFGLACFISMGYIKNIYAFI